MSLASILATLGTVVVRQRLELGELVGFETRNKYGIENESGEAIAFAAEQHKGVLGFLMRQLLGHFRRFEILFFDAARKPVMRAVHPFRFFFQRLEVHGEQEELLGVIEQRFSLLYKRFDVQDATGRVTMEVRSPLWRLWTFVFTRDGREVARIEKKWSGLLTEAFTDKDRFRVQLGTETTAVEKLLLLAAAIFVDLQYFEKKAS